LEINDIGILGLKELREKLKDVFKWVQNKLPGSVLIFSQILQRTKWRYSENNKSMEAK
jgi:hypothetical protein